MDLGLHMERYMESVRADAFTALKDFVLTESIDGRPATEVLQDSARAAVAAVENGDEASYWEELARHQKALFTLQTRYTARLLQGVVLGESTIWDFIERHGWRRFRFSECVVHMEMRFGEDLWTVSVIPNYLTGFLEKVKERNGSIERRATLDAIEMENLLRHGDPAKVGHLLKEKNEDYAGCRHILWGSDADPSFLKLRLKNTNSTMHVSDWILPLRS